VANTLEQVREAIAELERSPKDAGWILPIEVAIYPGSGMVKVNGVPAGQSGVPWKEGLLSASRFIAEMLEETQAQIGTIEREVG
jgi:hypothetical protein